MQPRVMVVEDDEALLQLVSKILSEEYLVKSFWSAVTAYEALEGIPDDQLPKAIVTDVVMPKMDGFTFASRLLETERTRSIPLVVMTGRTKVMEVFKSLPNVFAFLEKPLRRTTLTDTVGRAVKRSTPPAG